MQELTAERATYLERLTEKALHIIEDGMDDSDPKVQLRAAEDILQRTIPVKQDKQGGNTFVITISSDKATAMAEGLTMLKEIKRIE